MRVCNIYNVCDVKGFTYSIGNRCGGKYSLYQKRRILVDGYYKYDDWNDYNQYIIMDINFDFNDEKMSLYKEYIISGLRDEKLNKILDENI